MFCQVILSVLQFYCVVKSMWGLSVHCSHQGLCGGDCVEVFLKRDLYFGLAVTRAPGLVLKTPGVKGKPFRFLYTSPMNSLLSPSAI